MQIAIIEDEIYAAKRLQQMIGKIEPSAQLVLISDSIEETSTWLQSHLHPQLFFMDIQLADGLSFKIFERVKINAPVIFTTAFHEYTLEAFKLHSIDYLLKPIKEEQLAFAIEKYKKYYASSTAWSLPNWTDIMDRIKAQTKAAYKERFMVRKGDAYASIQTKEIKCFYSDTGYTMLQTVDDKRYIVDMTLEQLEKVLHPAQYFRINRKHIISIEVVQEIHPYFNSRLLLKAQGISDELIVSRDRVKTFKKWMGEV